TVVPGTLQPSFSGANTQYTVDLANNVPRVTVTAQPAVAGDSVTINGEATTSRSIDLGAAGTTTPVNIAVSESGTNSRTYTVLLTKASLTGNNSLRSLSTSPGPLEPGFNANTLSYEVSVASNVDSMRVTPTLEDPSATMTVNGQTAASGQAQTIPLHDPGLTTILTIAVTAQDGTPKTYTVVVSRAALGGNNNLQSLTVSPGGLNPSFSATRTSYTVNVGGRVGSITVTAAPRDTNASLTINGQETNSRSIPLPEGPSSTDIQVIVTAPNGTPKPYFITVNRAALSSDNNLETLTVTPGTLNPPFAPGTLAYTVEVATGITNVDVSATKSDSNAVISGNLPNGGRATIPLDGPGTSKNLLITVTAPNGDSKTYTITVTRLAPSTDSNLSNLTVSAGSLNPSFAASTLNYTVDVASSIDSLTASATKSDPEAVMSASSAVIAPSGDPTGSVTVTLGLGISTPIAITVTAEDRVTTKTYRISVNRPSR
ncbi:MAG: cadherin-like beta sandwich domain-containing protein, partial [Nitrospira sp.]|nr:cadherin-like beta sandwich domain-containing protein [Nitrospira sp.]